MSYTVGDIPLWGITSVMTEDSNDRNNILTAARVVAGVGGAVSLLAIQPVGTAIGDTLAKTKYANLENDLALMQGQRYGYLCAAVIFAFVGCVLFQLVGIFTKERIKPSEQKNSIKDNFILMWKNKPFRQILLSGILASPKSITMIVAFTLINIYFANNDASQMLIWYVKLGPGLLVGYGVGMLIVTPLSKKLEKRLLYNISNLGAAIPFVLIFVMYMAAPNHDVTGTLYLILFNVLFVFAGFSIGAQMVLQSIMIADCVDYEEYKSGLRPDGVFFSGQSFITKLSAGIATIMCSLGYLAVDFQQEKRQEVMLYMKNGLGLARENPEFQPFMMIMFFLISVPPAIGCILSAIPTWKYAMSNKEHESILKTLNEKRHKENQAEVDG